MREGEEEGRREKVREREKGRQGFIQGGGGRPGISPPPKAFPPSKSIQY